VLTHIYLSHTQPHTNSKWHTVAWVGLQGYGEVAVVVVVVVEAWEEVGEEAREEAQEEARGVGGTRECAGGAGECAGCGRR
jgi:hypothetical protein